MRSPKLAGRWLVSAYVLGKGIYYGEMELQAGAAEDEFNTRVKLQSIKDGSTLTRTGQRFGVCGICVARPVQGNGAANAAPDDLGKRGARSAVVFTGSIAVPKGAGSGDNIRNSALT